MTREELNYITGVDYTIDEYAILDSAYLSSGMEKVDFCEELSKVQDNIAFKSILKNALGKNSIVESLVNTDPAETSIAHKLIDKSVELQDENLANVAIEIIGRTAFIKYKIENNLHLFRKDRDYLLELVGEERLIEILNNQVA